MCQSCKIFTTIMMLICNMFYGQSIDNFNNSSKDGLKASLELEKTLFNYGSPIDLKMVITNKNYKEALFLGAQVFLNYYVEIFYPNGTSVQEKDSYFSTRFETIEKLKKEKQSILKTQFIERQLKPEEIIGVKINLLDYYDLKPGKYLLRFKFYPASVYYNPRNVYYSPYVQLIINDASAREIQDLKQKQFEEMQLTVKTPEQTVLAFFDAKQHNNWDQFFYCLDLKSLIKIFNQFNEAYDSANDSDKNSILNDFRIYLKDINSSEKILNWEIEETTIRKNQAIVKVIVHSLVRGINVGREYLFRLEKRNHWYIQAYSVLENNKFEF